ncbi:MAG: hypothetical protein GY694_22095 [Gammaproteobacteria bacterium]|nr:hypothetical protein [Gammaproteobacteria bacterium]
MNYLALLFAITITVTATFLPNSAKSQQGSTVPTVLHLLFEDDESDFVLTSIAVSGGKLLDSYKCEDKDIITKAEKSIPLSWSNVPSAAESLAIIMHHYPNPDDTSQVNSYLLLWDIAPTVTGIGHGEADDGPWYMGANKDEKIISYSSPCSPPLSGTHEYTITLYALSETPEDLPDESNVEVTYSVLKGAIDTVTTIDIATLTFNDVATEE